MLQTAQVRLRSATSDDMEVLGSIALRGKYGKQAVESTALVADRATKSLWQATNARVPRTESICHQHSPYSSTNEMVAYRSRDVAGDITLKCG